MKKLPIGLQSFEEITHGGYVYVDKTLLIHSLITEGKYYFLSRPRRFGKSLLIDTLKNLLAGKKDLFKELAIHSMNYDWKSHPIIHLDFSLIPHHTPEIFYAALERRLHTIASENGISIDIPTLEEGLINLVSKLASKKDKVVVLIDEYDKPLIDHLDDLEIAKTNRTILKNFFTVLKGLDAQLRLVFITGVSKFSQVSLFSGINNLNDITISPKYAALLGYTEKEIFSFFKERIHILSRKQDMTDEQLVELMRRWYNGYNFSREKHPVYNPFSTLLFLENGEINNYWFQTATPTFLIDQIKQQSYPLDQLSGIEVGDTLFNSHDLEKINLVSLMWQTGYLTIKSYNPSTRLYCLDYPNEEVRIAFLEHLAEGITGLPMPQVTGFARKCANALQEQNLPLFFSYLKALFANIPYDMNVAEEKYYQTIFFIIAQLIGLEAELEVKTNLGRIDMIINLKKEIYLIEFKINSTAEKALKQINDKKYYQKFMVQKKNLILVGVNFDIKERNITEWTFSSPHQK